MSRKTLTDMELRDFIEATRQWARWCCGMDDIVVAHDAVVVDVVETMNKHKWAVSKGFIAKGEPATLEAWIRNRRENGYMDWPVMAE